MPEGRYPMIFPHQGGYGVGDIFLWTGRVWAIGYRKRSDSELPWLLAESDDAALIPFAEVRNPDFLKKWQAENCFAAIAIVPAGTVLSWSFRIEDFPEDVAGWAEETGLISEL